MKPSSCMIQIATSSMPTKSSMSPNNVDDTPLSIPTCSMYGPNSPNTPGGPTNMLRVNTSLPGTPSTSLWYTDSVAQDLEKVLSLTHYDDTPKGVKFEPYSPEEVPYQVSHSIDEYAMRRPGKLFPPILPQSVSTAQQLIECSAVLQLAAAKALVTPRVDAVDGYHFGREGSILACITSPGTPAESEIAEIDYFSNDETPSASSPRMGQFIDLYVQQNLGMNHNVHFDKVSVTASNDKTVLLSSKGLSSGKHQWSIEIMRTGVDLQEIGVIGTNDIDRIAVSDDGALDTAAFQTRALYGCELNSGMLFYGSLNADGAARCTRDLRSTWKCGWTVGSLITVQLDLEKWRIKFLINGQAVLYTMSLEPNKEYFPTICFSGNCQYFLHY